MKTPENYNIYVDAGQPARSTTELANCPTVPTPQEAVLAWHALPAEQKTRAIVKVIGGPVYAAHHFPSVSLWS